MENKDDQLVKRLGTIGYGGEAKVYIEIRNFFPGIGWDIYTTQRVACANREDFNPSKKIGHYNFLRHSIIKKLDDYFISLGMYSDIHIPRPLGSTDESYIYEFEPGSDSFPWEFFDGENRVMVNLEEWGNFVGSFLTAGINFSLDITDAEDGRISQNIVIENYPSKLDCLNPSISSLWKRIDFGTGSTLINYDKLKEFLSENKEKLMVELSTQRYELLSLALKYLKEKPEHMDKRDIGRLEILAGEFRISTLSHFNKRGSSSDFSKKHGVYPTQQRID